MSFIIIIVSILVHEFGHFITAIKFNIPIKEFSIGFGPKIFSKNFRKTTFSFRPLLFGGYVAYKGDFQDLLKKHSTMNMLVFSLAGPLFNLLLFLIVLTICYIIKNNNIFINDLIIEILNTFLNINLNLGILNLLPIPPLDGSKLILIPLFKKVKEKKQKEILNIYAILSILFIFIILLLNIFL